ncbi:hypothetical protein PVAND_015896 [Polypedilum vanderplanki]|uniref:Uncharacterized protein n=1 Tax=Polypedilum vanderplanki TaxID=319348 RepID=A0A9J6BEJ6_POLVA|nr:hypothetical protein PVAND_015896 [Polypedilum vanderplanki]
MKILILLLFSCVFATVPNFDEFRKMYHKSYKNKTELNLAKKNYEAHVAYIERFNSKKRLPYKLGINKYSDLSPTKKKRLNGYRSSIFSSLIERSEELVAERGILPNFVDWRNSNAVSPVQDQGFYCGSCWAYSAAGALEGSISLSRRTPAIQLSIQQFIDCNYDAKIGNFGCDGGFMNVALFYSSKFDITTGVRYPYMEARNNCSYTKPQTKFVLSSPVQIPKGDEDALKVAVATIGPVATAMDGDHASFYSYSSGVYYEPNCTQWVNHGVLIVGYGTDPVGGDYWLAKNSWSANWGEDGFFKIARNRGNHCGIANNAVYIKINKIV